MSVEFKKSGVVNGSIIERQGDLSVLKNDIVINPNLAKSTYFTSDYSARVTVDTSLLYNGMPTMKISASGYSSNSYTAYSQAIPGLSAGDIVTVSVAVYRKDDHGIDNHYEMRLYQTHNDGSANNWSGFAPSSANWVPNKWLYLQKTYILDSNFSAAAFNLNVVKNGTYWFSAFKVEHGVNATPWIPNISEAIYTSLNFGALSTAITNPIEALDIIEN